MRARLNINRIKPPKSLRLHKVYKDFHGVYVKADGQIFRPQINIEYYEPKEDQESKFAVGDKVEVKLKNDFLWALVGDEYWYGHGYLYGKKSEDCWMV